jgi:hypothetical protein
MKIGRRKAGPKEWMKAFATEGGVQHARLQSEASRASLPDQAADGGDRVLRRAVVGALGAYGSLRTKTDIPSSLQ